MNVNWSWKVFFLTAIVAAFGITVLLQGIRGHDLGDGLSGAALLLLAIAVEINNFGSKR